MKRFYVFFTIVICFNISFAQDFEVAPVLMKFTAEPGQSQTRVLSVRNHANSKQKFTLKLSDYTIDKDGNKKAVPAGSTERSCTNWMTLNPTFFELNPNESAEIDVLMNVPSTGNTSTWGMIIVQAVKEKSASQADKEMATGVVIVPRIVALVQQSPKSNTNYNGTIQNLKEITKEGNVQREFEVEVENTGDKVLDAKVSLALANIMTAEEERFDSEKVTVYPGSTRKITLKLPKAIATGKYALAAILDYGHRKPIEATQIMIDQQ